MRRMLIALCGLCWSLGAAAQAPPDLLQQVGRLSGHPQVRAQFIQQRSSPALSAPQLLFVLGHGMLWRIEQPDQQTLWLGEHGAAQVDAAGHTVALRGERGASQVSQILQAMLAGHDETALRQFAIDAAGSPRQWTLRLTPCQPRMRQILTTIELPGGNHLDSISIALANGERSQIQLQQTRDAGALEPLERRVLGLP